MAAVTSTLQVMSKLSKIKPEWMTAYLNREMTSLQLAELSGYAAPYIRRAIPREPVENKGKAWRKERKTLREARNKFHDSIASRPLAEIMYQANVSRSTALRIKKRNATKTEVQK